MDSSPYKHFSAACQNQRSALQPVLGYFCCAKNSGVGNFRCQVRRRIHVLPDNFTGGGYLENTSVRAFTDKSISVGLPLDSADVVTEEGPDRPIAVFRGVFPGNGLVQGIDLEYARVRP